MSTRFAVDLHAMRPSTLGTLADLVSVLQTEEVPLRATRNFIQDVMDAPFNRFDVDELTRAEFRSDFYHFLLSRNIVAENPGGHIKSLHELLDGAHCLGLTNAAFRRRDHWQSAPESTKGTRGRLGPVEYAIQNRTAQ